LFIVFFFFFSSRRRHTRSKRDRSSDVCSSDLFIYFFFYFSVALVVRGEKSPQLRAFSGLMPCNRLGNGIATGSATGCGFPGFFRKEVPSAPELPKIRPAFFHTRLLNPFPY